MHPVAVERRERKWCLEIQCAGREFDAQSKGAAEYDSSTKYFGIFRRRTRKKESQSSCVRAELAVKNNSTNLWGIQTQGYRIDGDGFVAYPLSYRAKMRWY